MILSQFQSDVIISREFTYLFMKEEFRFKIKCRFVDSIFINQEHIYLGLEKKKLF